MTGANDERARFPHLLRLGRELLESYRREFTHERDKARETMFDLKRPCVDCPFRKGQGEHFRLAAARLREIRRSISFQCHRTVDYEHWDDRDKRAGDRPQQCAGLMAVLMRDNAANTIMQIAERWGHLDLSKLDPEHEAYESWDAACKAHEGR